VAQAPAANTSATLAADLVALAHEDQGWAAGAAAGGDGGSGEAGLDLSLLTACLLPSAQVGREALELPMAPSSCEAALAMLAAASPEQLLTHQGHMHECQQHSTCLVCPATTALVPSPPLVPVVWRKFKLERLCVPLCVYLCVVPFPMSCSTTTTTPPHTHQVEEADEVWDMGLVFTSVKAALQAEADPTSVAAAGGHQDAGAVGLMGGA
jgi:hypothetical protein